MMPWFIKNYIQYKLFEWVMSLNALLTGLIIMFSPDSVIASAFRYTLFAQDARVSGLVFVVCGGVCLAMLFVNSKSHKWGPKIRAWCAIFRAIIWFQLGMSLVAVAFDAGVPSPVLANWLSLLLGEMIAAYQAGRDVTEP